MLYRMLRRLILLSAASVILLLGGVLLYLATVREGLPPARDPLQSLEQPLWPIPEFELLNANGQIVSNTDLRDRIWLAAFIFTRCPGPCPLISRQMSMVQEQLADLENFRLVSFTVDPEFDRPEILEAYADQYGAQSARWWFLTEDDPGEMAAVVRDFKIALQREAAEASPVPDITHGTSLLLVDGAGLVRAVFRSSDPDVVDQVERAVRTLRSETPASAQ